MAALIGILGGGQLGRMLALAGYPLGLRFRFLDPAPGAPAGELAEHVVGSYDDPGALQSLAREADAVTYEFENVPVEAVQQLAHTTRLFPPPGALAAAQDRLSEKQLFVQAGIPTPGFAAVSSRAELKAALERIGLPAVLKTRRLGYDGKGQRVLHALLDIDAAWAALSGADLLVESFVPFERELALLAVRARDGATAFYPLVETRHRDGVLRLALAPAQPCNGALQALAEDYAQRLLTRLAYVGVLALELFQVGGELWANEIAPRVHNSGHWTIEGAETSQFENHLRAGLGLPLGSTAARGYAAMLNLLGELPSLERVLPIPGAHLHLYGKAPRAGRKLGHITLCAGSAEALAAKLATLNFVWEA